MDTRIEGAGLPPPPPRPGARCGRSPGGHGSRRGPRRTGPGLLAAALLALAGAGATSFAEARAQTITGTLIDVESGAPIPLGLVMMYTASGDSVTQTISDGVGRFLVASPDPGSFVLRAAALGYGESTEGVFELGEGAAMEVEYRLRPAPLPLEALLVSVDRPVLDHHLVRNGFVRRLQRGLGKFITPHDIEESPARSTESLLEGIPQVRVGVVSEAAGGLLIPSPHIGETVQIAGPYGGWCTPVIYVDGMRTSYGPSRGLTLSNVAHIGDVEAIEVYRRPAEVPVEFATGRQQAVGPDQFGGGPQSGCGVLVVWTKRGLAPGQRPTRTAPPTLRADGTPGLPTVRTRGAAPVAGERIRVDVAPEVAERVGLESPWHGRFVSLDAGALVATDEVTGRPVAVPLDAVREVQVERLRGSGDAWRRGAVRGAAFGLGTWGFLTFLCAYTCGAEADQETVLPSVLAGLFVGGVVVSGGPRTQWVGSALPEVSAGSGSGGLGLGFRLPVRAP